MRMFSPALWTTIATGHNREQHGINWFIPGLISGKSEKRMVATMDRKRLALWNIVSAFKKSVGTVGWWVTWPAEPVNGFVVSDRVAHSRWNYWSESSPETQLTYPAELFHDIKGQIVDPLNPPMEEINRLVQLTPEEKDEFLKTKKPIFSHGLSIFKYGYCAQRTYENIALEMFKKSQPDLGMVFLIGVDPICHTFWHFFEPDKFNGKVNKDSAERLGKLIPSIYEHNDRYVAKLLSKIDKNTVVIIVSDHGFHAGSRLPAKKKVISYRFAGSDRVDRLKEPVTVGMSGNHDIEGLFIARGGAILQGAKPVKQPSVADITPTVLALMGLPVGRDMSGRVLSELIDPEFLEKHPVQYIDSYEKYIDRKIAETDSRTGEDKQLEYLRALGYIE